jgi:hypothetical protein
MADPPRGRDYPAGGRGSAGDEDIELGRWRRGMCYDPTGRSEDANGRHAAAGWLRHGSEQAPSPGPVFFCVLCVEPATGSVSAGEASRRIGAECVLVATPDGSVARPHIEADRWRFTVQRTCLLSVRPAVQQESRAIPPICAAPFVPTSPG